jgi:hypothetical protein
LIYLDTKKLDRIAGIGYCITGDRTRQSSNRGKGWGPGWEALHVAIDDASRLPTPKTRRRRALPPSSIGTASVSSG